MAEMSFGARRHTAVRQAQESAPTFNIQALLQGCVASRPEEGSDHTPLIVDFPDRPAKMLAAVLPDYGPSSRIKVQLCDLPRLPLGKLKSTEVVVEVHSASVNPTDCKQRKGLLSQIWPLSLPCVLGIDLAGRVVRAGEDAPFSEGDEVFGRQQLGRMVDLNGSYAEYCIVEGFDLFRKPSTLSMDEAAAVPYACLAAYAALAHVGKLAEKRKQADKAVLVLGGSGGVGTYAVQLAKHHFGCFVMASCSERNLQLMKDLGVDEAVDYSDPSFFKAMGYTKFDVIVDTVGGDEYWMAFKDALKADGVYVSTVGKTKRSEEATTMDYSKALQYRADYFLRQAFNSIGADKNYHLLTGSQILSSDLRIIASIFEKGTVRPIIDSVYSLYDIAKAHEKSETHHVVGKLVIQVRKGGQSQAEHSKGKGVKTDDLQERIQGVLANKGLGPSVRNTASALPNSRGKVQFNGLEHTAEERGDSEDEYPDMDDKPTPLPPASKLGSRTRDLLGEMTFGAPGVTTTATKPLSSSGSRPGTAPGTGAPGSDILQNRLEQLQREVMESTARVQALKQRNSNIGSGALPFASAAASVNSGASLPPIGSVKAAAKPEASKLARDDLRMGKGLASGMEEIAVDEPGGSSSMGLDPHKLEEGLKALQEQREMHAPHKRAEEVPEDNPFRPPTSMGSFAPPSTDGNDPAAAAKRAAALAKLREMTLGQGMDDPRLAPPPGLGPADVLLGGAPGSRGEGVSAGGMSAAALREARLKAEVLKAKQGQLKAPPPPQPDEDEEEEIQSDEDEDGPYRPSGRRSNGDEVSEMSAREAARMGLGMGTEQGPASARKGGGEEDATAWFNKFKQGVCMRVSIYVLSVMGPGV
jgi:NADPH:quinone reductase-like Zn-dependent oxidoreductase